MLKDALARIPVDDEEQIMGAMEDLKRMCCSTSFMFMYSQVREKWVFIVTLGFSVTGMYLISPSFSLSLLSTERFPPRSCGQDGVV